jgi:hypothetical protein
MGVFRAAEQRGTLTLGNTQTGRDLAVNRVKYVALIKYMARVKVRSETT